MQYIFIASKTFSRDMFRIFLRLFRREVTIMLCCWTGAAFRVTLPNVSLLKRILPDLNKISLSAANSNSLRRNDSSKVWFEIGFAPRRLRQGGMS